jgi:DNA-binding LacI/PurR family transcriptional regulator
MSGSRSRPPRGAPITAKDDVSLEPGRDAPAADRRRAPATSTDVARRAGVSRATVSHILNGQVARFAPETAEKVRQAAADLGYVRSAAGRALVMGRSDFVVIVVPDATLTNIQSIVEAISADLDDLGFSPVVHFSRTGVAGEPLARLQHTVETLRPAGLIDLGGLSPEVMDALDALGCPVLNSPPTSRMSLMNGNVSIGRLQAEHLAERGARLLAYAFPTGRDDAYGRMRVDGVDEVCAERGWPAAFRFEVPTHPEGARVAVAGLLAQVSAVQVSAAQVSAAQLPAGPVTGSIGIACSTDEVALATCFAALGLGLAVPGDVAVIGVGAEIAGQLVTPRLSTVTFDMHQGVRVIREAVEYAFGGRSRGPDPYPGGTFSLLAGQTT